MSELLKKYYNIMDMYKNGEFGTEHLSLAEILERAGEPDLINRMNQSEIQHLIDNSTGLMKHMFIELKSKIKETSGVNKEQKFDVLAVPCNRAFVVSKEKSEAFKNSKSNLETRNNGLAVLTPAPKEGYLPSEQEMEILRSRKKSRKNSENIISDVNIFLTKEDHEQIAEKVIYSILDDTNLFSDESNGNEQEKEMGEILNRMLDSEPKNINPLTELPEPQMKLYGFYGAFASAFFETEKEQKEYVEKNDTEFGNTCIIEYLGHVAGRDDVIRLTYKGDKSKLYTSVNEDGYGVYNEERSKYKGEFVWEFNYGSIRELYSAFRNRGIVFEDDIYAKIDERNQKLFELLDANRKGPVLTKVKKDNKN